MPDRTINRLREIAERAEDLPWASSLQKDTTFVDTFNRAAVLALLDIAEAAARLMENRDGRLPLILDVDALVVAVETLIVGES